MKISRRSVGAGGFGAWTSIVPDIRAGNLKALVSPSRFGRWHLARRHGFGLCGAGFFRRFDAHRHARGDLRRHRGCVKTAYKDPVPIQRMTPLAEVVGSAAKEFGEFTTAKRAKWGKLITDLKIRVDD
jgi:hypothetical protein